MVDSHCHLADPAFAEDLPEVVARARAAGVAGAVCILSADDEAELARAEAVAAAWPAVRMAAAVHPHRAGAYAGRVEAAVAATRRALRETRAVAIGEIGLDYHYDFAPREAQRAVFEAQVALAAELALPVVVHTREAIPDTLAVLRRAGDGTVRAVLHCFTGTADEARLALDAGCYLSFAGIVTFPGARALAEVAAFVPPDRLLAETDSPYLAPVPHRGRRNEPAFVVETIARLAALRGVEPAGLGARIAANLDALLAGSLPRHGH